MIGRSLWSLLRSMTGRTLRQDGQNPFSHVGLLLKNEGAKYNKCTEMDIVPKTTCTELDMYRSGHFGTEVVMYWNLVYQNGHVPKVSCTELDLTLSENHRRPKNAQEIRRPQETPENVGGDVSCYGTSQDALIWLYVVIVWRCVSQWFGHVFPFLH